MIAYLDTPSGLSGDMFLGCLVDAGWPIDELRQVVTRLNLPAGEWSIDAAEVQRGPIRATHVAVNVNEPAHHRHLADIRHIIDAADLPAEVRDGATAVFTRLARAEAAVHASTIDAVHFHEVGATDAIIDIVGAAAGLHALQIDQLYASPVPLGDGWVTTAHGRLPIPAPAVLEILTEAHAPTRQNPAANAGELLTPTGAAVVAHFAIFEQPAMQLENVGSGAGSKQFDWPNIARLLVGQPQQAGPMIQLETNIDDMNPQFYQPVTEKLFAAGAVDVWLTPIQMKKGRPAVTLSAIAPAACETALADILLRQTSTFGLRVQNLRRHEAARTVRQVETPYGPVNVKCKWHAGSLIAATPEYDDCQRLAEQTNTPLQTIHQAAQSAAHSLITCDDQC